MKRISLALAFALIAAPAMAHDWYEAECCNMQDCEPIPANQVTRTPEGWRMPNGYILPYGAGRKTPAQASGFHWCRWHREGRPLVQPHGKPVCIYVPESQL